MANEILRSKHAFGASELVDQKLAEGIIDERDLLMLDEDTDDPKFGWVSKSGKPIIVPTGKANIAELKEDVAKLEAESKSVTEKLESITSEIETLECSKDVADYEISSKPEGAIVDYRDKEIRIMCPTNTEWKLQQSGDGADKNKFYIGFKAYAPNDDVVNFKEDLAEIIVDETMYSFVDNAFAGVDENAHKYSIVWLPVAVYDEANKTWSYYGENSSTSKYFGWYYSVEWYDANGTLVASDCIRINLTNESCHSSIEPYYVGNIMKEVDAKIEEKITEINTGYEIVEF